MRRLGLVACGMATIAAVSAGAQVLSEAIARCHSYTSPQLDNPDRAIAGCTAVTESNAFSRDERLEALATRGTLFRKTGRFDLAVVDLTEVLRNRPSADDIYVERGMALVATGEPARALADFDRAIQLNADNVSALRQRAVAYRERRLYDEAIHDLDRAVALDPRDPWAVSERGLDYFSKAEYDLAIRDFNRALELTPSSAWTMAERGAAYRLKGQYERAIVDLTSASALDEDGWTFDQRGAAYLQLGRFDTAIADFTRAIELNEGDAWALYTRGIARRRAGDVAGAADDMSAATKLRSDIPAQLAKEGIQP